MSRSFIQNLWPFKGALCSLTTSEEGGFWKKFKGESKILNGSRFAVLNSVEFTEDLKKSFLNRIKILLLRGFYRIRRLSQSVPENNRIRADI